MATQSRLYHMKSWLTLEDAASHLTTLLSEQVRPQDILQLGLEKRLTLSVLLAPTCAIKGEITSIVGQAAEFEVPGKPSVFLIIKPSETEKKAVYMPSSMFRYAIANSSNLEKEFEKGEVILLPLSSEISEGKVMTWQDDVVQVEGVWDLPMLAAERSSIQELYQELIGGPKKVLWELDGAWVERNGEIYCLQQSLPITTDAYETLIPENSTRQEALHNTSDNLYPMVRLPADSKIVMRRQHLDAFLASPGVKSVDESSESEQLRPSHLLTIAALLDVLKNNKRFNYNQGSIIKEIEDRQKDVYGLSEDNLNKIFAKANSALKEARESMSP